MLAPPPPPPPPSMMTGTGSAAGIAAAPSSNASASSASHAAFSSGPPPSNQEPAADANAAAAAATNVSSLFSIETQHEDIIHDLQMDFYGSKLATCSSDRTIKIFNVSSSSGGEGGSYELVATLQGHEGPVWQVSWAHPKFGILLASCSFDGSVWIHRETRPREWAVIHAARNLHESSVNSVTFGPEDYQQGGPGGDRMILAAASSDGRVSVLEHDPGTQMWTVDYITDCPMGVNAVSWAPGNAFYSDQQETEQQSESDMAQQHHHHQQQQPSSCVLALVTAGCDNRIRFWQRSDTMRNGSNNTSGMGVWTQENVPQCATNEDEGNNNNNNSDLLVSHRDWVRDVAWAPSPLIPNGNRVASCGEDGQVLMWTLVTPKKTKAMDDESSGGSAPPPQSYWKATLVHQFDEPVWRVSWSTTGLILAVSSGDSTVTLWKEDWTSDDDDTTSKWIRMDQRPLGVESTATTQPRPAST